MKLKDGAFCKVIAGTHKGKSGTVRDIKTSKTGHVTITVVPKVVTALRRLPRMSRSRAAPTGCFSRLAFRCVLGRPVDRDVIRRELL